MGVDLSFLFRRFVCVAVVLVGLFSSAACFADDMTTHAVPNNLVTAADGSFLGYYGTVGNTIDIVFRADARDKPIVSNEYMVRGPFFKSWSYSNGGSTSITVVAPSSATVAANTFHELTLTVSFASLVTDPVSLTVQCTTYWQTKLKDAPESAWADANVSYSFITAALTDYTHSVSIAAIPASPINVWLPDDFTFNSANPIQLTASLAPADPVTLWNWINVAQSDPTSNIASDWAAAVTEKNVSATAETGAADLGRGNLFMKYEKTETVTVTSGPTPGVPAGTPQLITSTPNYNAFSIPSNSVAVAFSSNWNLTLNSSRTFTQTSSTSTTSGWSVTVGDTIPTEFGLVKIEGSGSHSWTDAQQTQIATTAGYSTNSNWGVSITQTVQPMTIPPGDKVDVYGVVLLTQTTGTVTLYEDSSHNGAATAKDQNPWNAAKPTAYSVYPVLHVLGT